MKVKKLLAQKILFICLIFNWQTSSYGSPSTKELIETIEKGGEGSEEMLQDLQNLEDDDLFDGLSMLSYLIENNYPETAGKLLNALGPDFPISAKDVVRAFDKRYTALAKKMMLGTTGNEIISEDSCLLVYILNSRSLSRNEKHHYIRDVIFSDKDRFCSSYLYKGKELKILNILVIFEEKELVEDLLDAGIKLEHEDYLYTLELLSNKVYLLKKLIEKGYQIEVEDKYYGTFLHRAAKSGDLDLVKLLLEKGEDPNAINSRQETPLSLSLNSSDLRVLDALLENGADPKQEVMIHLTDNNHYYGSPLAYCIEKFDYMFLVKLLKSEHVDQNQAQQIIDCFPPQEIQKYVGAERALKLINSNKEGYKSDFSSYKSSRFLSYGGVKNKRFDEVYAGEVSEKISKFRRFLNSQDDLVFDYDPSFKQTILFHGPTGTGKTTLAYAIASESGLPFFKLEANEIETKWIGESEGYFAQIFKDLYDYAFKNDTKVVLFIDEIDNLLSNRGTEGGGYDAYQYKLISVFLNYFGENEHDTHRTDFLKRIVLVGATNYLEKIPDNVKSRFFLISEIPNPDRELRAHILSYHLRKLKSDIVDVNEDDIYEIAANDCQGMNARQIADAVKKAGRDAYIELKDENGDGIIRRRHFEFLKKESSLYRSSSFDRYSHIYN